MPLIVQPSSPPAGRQLQERSVAVVFGTRPEIIKLARVVALLGDRAWVIYSGQHYDPTLSDGFFTEFCLPEPDSVLGVGGIGRAGQLGQTVATLGALFDERRPRAVVVQGDTNTAAAGAIAANACDVPLLHVEAGLRSYDRRMPEEHNRVVADHLADVCCAPTTRSALNLAEEGIRPDRIVVTGNTVIDMVARTLPGPADRRAILADLGLAAGSYVLATFHRPENVDDARRLACIVDQLERIGRPVLLPLHPRTRRRLADFGIGLGAQHLRMVPPIGYRRFIALAADCACIVSDSGGVQEEASYLKKPVLVVRRSTERPEVLGTFARLEPRLHHVAAATEAWITAVATAEPALTDVACPYGDGFASERCVEAIIDLALRPAKQPDPPSAMPLSNR